MCDPGSDDAAVAAAYKLKPSVLGSDEHLAAIGRQLKLAGCAKLTERTSGSIVVDDPDGAIAGRKEQGFSVGKWLNVFGARWKSSDHLIRQLCRRLYDADALAGAGRDQLIALSVERLNGFVAGFDKRKLSVWRSAAERRPTPA